jgi:hypothetical protein
MDQATQPNHTDELRVSSDKAPSAVGGDGWCDRLPFVFLCKSRSVIMSIATDAYHESFALRVTININAIVFLCARRRFEGYDGIVCSDEVGRSRHDPMQAIRSICAAQSQCTISIDQMHGD